MYINWTQIAGLIAFVPACLAALAAGGAGALLRRTWLAVGAIYALLAVEVITRTRYQIADGFRQWLMKAGLYPDRRPVQAIVLLILLALAGFVAAQLVRRAPSRTMAIARGATAVILALFVAESVSLHVIDGILYSPAGPVLLIGWLWLVFGWAAAIAATIECLLAGTSSN